MLYIVHFLYDSLHYFLLVFYMLKDKIKLYSSRFVFNFFWLAELVQSFKPSIGFLPTTSHLVRELPQSCEMMFKALDLGLIFCPSKKGANHDGCFYNPETGKIIETIQFKLKEEGAPLHWDTLITWAQKYRNLDIVDVGFQLPQPLEQYKDLLIQINEFSYSEGLNLVFTFTDYSSYNSEHTCRPGIKDILEIQASFNDIVIGVNDKMIDSCGEILIPTMFF